MPKRSAKNKNAKAKKSRGSTAAVQPRALQQPQIQLPDIPFSLPKTTLAHVFGNLSAAEIVKFAFSSFPSFHFINNNLRLPATRILLRHTTSLVSTLCFIQIDLPNLPTSIIIIDANPFGAHRATDKILGRDADMTTGVQDQKEVLKVVFKKAHDARIISTDLTKLIIKVFPTSDFQMMSHCTERDELFSIVQRIPKFSVMNFESTSQNCMSHGELQFLMENLQIDTLRITAYLANVKYSGRLHNRMLDINMANWLTGKCLLDMKCQFLGASESEFTVDDINGFVKEWQTSRRNLKDLKIFWFEQHEKFSFSEEQEEMLEMTKWHPPMTFLEGEMEKLWYCRRWDGLLAFFGRNEQMMAFIVTDEGLVEGTINLEMFGKTEEIEVPEFLLKRSTARL